MTKDTLLVRKHHNKCLFQSNCEPDFRPLRDHAHKTIDVYCSGEGVAAMMLSMHIIFTLAGIHGQYNNMNLCKKEEENQDRRHEDTFQFC